MTTLKLRPVGSSTGVIFPKELLAKLDVKEGDELFVVESPEGLLLTPFDPEVARDVELGAGFMRKYRSTFRELAK
ncbi:MAG: AbrB/MazE/SpoVT family DNA-binding domain-containing protein [Bryobacter sp.]|jgi:putative addiction module antidote|nr:AbrB/MazE/SpoVT family DNA-binding domain-containing protein [Bryobacter sp.]